MQQRALERQKQPLPLQPQLLPLAVTGLLPCRRRLPSLQRRRQRGRNLARGLWSGFLPAGRRGATSMWRNLTRGLKSRLLRSRRRGRGATPHSRLFPSRRLGAAPNSHFVTRQRLEAETERRRRKNNHAMQCAPSHCPFARSRAKWLRMYNSKEGIEQHFKRSLK